jgi:hypothetical protein
VYGGYGCTYFAQLLTSQLELYEHVIGDKAMAKQANICANADSPEVGCHTYTSPICYYMHMHMHMHMPCTCHAHAHARAHVHAHVTVHVHVCMYVYVHVCMQFSYPSYHSLLARLNAPLTHSPTVHAPA